MKNLIRELVMLNAAFGSENFKDPQLRLDFKLIIELLRHLIGINLKTELRINPSCTDLELGEQCSDDCITQMFNCINNCGTDSVCQSACARDQVDCVDCEFPSAEVSIIGTGPDFVQSLDLSCPELVDKILTITDAFHFRNSVLMNDLNSKLVHVLVNVMMAAKIVIIQFVVEQILAKISNCMSIIKFAKVSNLKF